MFGLDFGRGLFACPPGVYMCVRQRQTNVRPPRT
nr:MAG TPA: hypothetical protein [Caudoviricetes sp.]